MYTYIYTCVYIYIYIIRIYIYIYIYTHTYIYPRVLQEHVPLLRLLELLQQLVDGRLAPH